MSYILDALRKSDQQRRRDAAPTLLTLQPAAVVRKRPAYLMYGLLALALVGAGVAIGWLRPWQAERAAPPGPESVAAKPAESKPIEARPLDASPDQPAQGPSAPGQAPEAPQPRVDIAAADAAGETVIEMDKLPPSILQELPKIAVSVHLYSETPAKRLVGIGSRILHEGDFVAPGLQLEQIEPDGMILSYKGYRFRRGVK